jgi:flagellar hook assembly protein FlgD
MQILGPSNVRHANFALTLAQPTSRATSGNGTSGTNGTNGTSGTGSASTSANSVTSLTSEQTFLQLLVAQIQNQDPLNPTDSIQFVSQLVQYAELGQLTGINQGVQTLDGSASSTTGTSGDGTSNNARIHSTIPTTGS